MTAPTPGELERAQALIRTFGTHPSCYQILNPGISLWFDPESGVVGFVDAGSYRVAAGEPVAPAGRLGQVACRFRDAARAAGRRTCFLAAESDLIQALEDDPSFTATVLGAQPVLEPAAWQATVRAHARLRAQLHRATNKHVIAAEEPADRAATDPALHRCLASWLGRRGLPPLHFLVETRTLERIGDRRIFVARRDGDVVGFTVAAPVPARRSWLLEQIVRRPDAPNGTAELLVGAALDVFAEEGAREVALGVAPLSRRAGPTRAPAAVRALLAWVRAHGRRFYNAEGLERFKAKFRPARWDPVYAVVDEPRLSLGAVWAIAAAYCGGSPLGTGARAAAHALRTEWQWLTSRRSGH